MKNGAPYQTLTRITEKRAQLGSPSQATGGTPTAATLRALAPA